jgi:hypothetical protein
VTRKSSTFYRNSILEASERNNIENRKSNENVKTSDRLDRADPSEVPGQELMRRRSRLGVEIGLSARENPSDKEIELVSLSKQKEFLAKLTDGY